MPTTPKIPANIKNATRNTDKRLLLKYYILKPKWADREQGCNAHALTTHAKIGGPMARC